MSERLALAAVAILGTVAIVIFAMRFGLSEGAIQSLVAGLVAPLTALVVAGGRIEAARLLPAPNPEQVSAITEAATKGAIASLSQRPTSPPPPYPSIPVELSSAAPPPAIPRAPTIPDIPEPKE